MRVIHAGGRVKWLGRWYQVEDGTLSVSEYEARFGLRAGNRQPMHSDCPRYDGRMDGKLGLFYTYGRHHAASLDHVYFHSMADREWPGPNCIGGYFVWESFRLEAPVAG